MEAWGSKAVSRVQRQQTYQGNISTNNCKTTKKDFDLGDIFTVIDQRWNVTVNTRITEVNEIYKMVELEIVNADVEGINMSYKFYEIKIKRTVVRKWLVRNLAFEFQQY